MFSLRNFFCAMGLFVAAMVASEGRAEPMLRGPHPFLKDNAVSIHGAASLGFADSFDGTKLLVDYDYKWLPAWWVNVQLNVVGGRCPDAAPDGQCGLYTGDAFEVLGGLKWKFRMDIPVVPYVKAGAGLVYVFPDDRESAMGLLARGGFGAHYFLFDWFGLGAEAAFSLGHVFLDEQYDIDETYAVFDVSVGVTLQFL